MSDGRSQPLSPMRRGDPIPADWLNEVARIAGPLRIVVGEAPVRVTRTSHGTSIGIDTTALPRTPRGILARITASAAQQHSWTESHLVVSESGDAGTFEDVEQGRTSEKLGVAYEINKRLDVPVDTIIWIEPHIDAAGENRWIFDLTAGLFDAPYPLQMFDQEEPNDDDWNVNTQLENTGLLDGSLSRLHAGDVANDKPPIWFQRPRTYDSNGNLTRIEPEQEAARGSTQTVLSGLALVDGMLSATVHKLNVFAAAAGEAVQIDLASVNTDEKVKASSSADTAGYLTQVLVSGGHNTVNYAAAGGGKVSVAHDAAGAMAHTISIAGAGTISGQIDLEIDELGHVRTTTGGTLTGIDTNTDRLVAAQTGQDADYLVNVLQGDGAWITTEVTTDPAKVTLQHGPPGTTDAARTFSIATSGDLSGGGDISFDARGHTTSRTNATISFTLAGTANTPAQVGSTGEGAETADSTSWSRTAQSGTDGVEVVLQSRTVYDAAGDQVLYGYQRTLKFDHRGLLLSISGETRYTIETPAECP